MRPLADVSACRGDRQLRQFGPPAAQSQTMTSPPPYWPAGMTPSNPNSATDGPRPGQPAALPPGQGWAPWHGPRREDAADLETEVVVESAGSVGWTTKRPRAFGSRRLRVGGRLSPGRSSGSGVRPKSRSDRYVRRLTGGSDRRTHRCAGGDPGTCLRSSPMGTWNCVPSSRVDWSKKGFDLGDGQAGAWLGALTGRC